MPFRSQKQRAWMYANDPAMAAKWERETPKVKLPLRVQKKSGGGLATLISALMKRAPEQGRRLQRAADEVPNLEQMYRPSTLVDMLNIPNSRLSVMRPETFEDYAAPLRRPDIGRLMRAAKHIDPTVGGTGFNEPMLLRMSALPEGSRGLYPEGSSIVTGHEGRHRSRALAEMGYDKSLVNIGSPSVEWQYGARSDPRYRPAPNLSHPPILTDMPQLGPGRSVVREDKRALTPWDTGFVGEPFKGGGTAKMSGGGLAELLKLISKNKDAFKRIDKIGDVAPKAFDLYRPDELALAIRDNNRSLVGVRPGKFEHAAFPIDTRSPESSLPLETKALDVFERDRIDELRNLIRGGTKFDDVPFLRVRSALADSGGDKRMLPFVAGHEGRHRHRAMFAEAPRSNTLASVFFDRYGADARPLFRFDKEFMPQIAGDRLYDGRAIPREMLRNFNDVFASEPFKNGGVARLAGGGPLSKVARQLMQDDKFRSWFGGSKAVMPDGSPMPLFRGMRAEYPVSPSDGFATRLHRFPSSLSTNRHGVYAAQHPDLADKFTPNNDGLTAPVFARVMNPLNMDSLDISNPLYRDARASFIGVGEEHKPDVDWLKRLRDAGHDAVYGNMKSNPFIGTPHGTGKGIEWFFPDPTSLRSPWEFKRGGPVRKSGGGLMEVLNLIRGNKGAMRRLEMLREKVPRAADTYNHERIAEALLARPEYNRMAAIRPDRFEHAARPIGVREGVTEPLSNDNLPEFSANNVNMLRNLMRGGTKMSEIPELEFSGIGQPGYAPYVAMHQGRHRNRAFSMEYPGEPGLVLLGGKFGNGASPFGMGSLYQPEINKMFGRGPALVPYENTFIGEPFAGGGKAALTVAQRLLSGKWKPSAENVSATIEKQREAAVNAGRWNDVHSTAEELPINWSAKEERNALDTLRREIGLSAPSIRTPGHSPEDIEDIIRMGFKNQHETRTSNGTLNPRLRTEVEDNHFGYTNEFPFERPKYGYLHTGNNWDAASQYGPIRWELDPRILNRATLSLRDSLYRRGRNPNIPGAALDPHKLMFEGNPFGYIKYADDYAGTATSPTSTPFLDAVSIVRSYPELQIHGPLDLNSVRAIHYRPEALGHQWGGGDDSALKIIDLLKRTGLPVIKGHRHGGRIQKRAGGGPVKMDKGGALNLLRIGRGGKGIIEETARGAATRAADDERVAQLLSRGSWPKEIAGNLQGSPFNSNLDSFPASSLRKQHSIGLAFDEGAKDNPLYRSGVMDAWGNAYPQLLDKHNIRSYDDFLEKSYDALGKETQRQFNAIKPVLNFSYHDGNMNYLDSPEMLRDLLTRKHLYVFRGGDRHDFLNKIDPSTGLNQNEIFRAVHDTFGHGIVPGASFGPKGEEKAWAMHNRMYSPLARVGMSSETRGQNSFVNYTPINADLKERMILSNDPEVRRQLGAEWQYAPQKSVVLPPEMLSESYAGDMPEWLRKIMRPKNPNGYDMTHWSNSDNLRETDPQWYGTGMKGAERPIVMGPYGAPKRTYFYLNDALREAYVGPWKYRARGEGLYDLNADPEKLRKLSSIHNMGDQNQRIADIERMIRERGYRGYAVPQYDAAAVFERQPVQRIHRKAGGLSCMCGKKR